MDDILLLKDEALLNTLGKKLFQSAEANVGTHGPKSRSILVLGMLGKMLDDLEVGSRPVLDVLAFLLG